MASNDDDDLTVARYLHSAIKFQTVDRQALDIFVQALNEGTLILGPKFDTDLRRRILRNAYFHARGRGGIKRMVVRPPGAGMLRLADLLVSRRTYERVFEPLVNDLRLEYFEALSQQRPWKARLIAARYWIAFVWNFFAGPLLAAIEKIRSISR